MASKLGLGHLFRWVRHRAAPKERDPADAGTAFGMELFLDAEARTRLPRQPPIAPKPPSQRPRVPKVRSG